MAKLRSHAKERQIAVLAHVPQKVWLTYSSGLAGMA
jgi:hypothetical protein